MVSGGRFPTAWGRTMGARWEAFVLALGSLQHWMVGRKHWAWLGTRDAFHWAGLNPATLASSVRDASPSIAGHRKHVVYPVLCRVWCKGALRFLPNSAFFCSCWKFVVSVLGLLWWLWDFSLFLIFPVQISFLRRWWTAGLSILVCILVRKRYLFLGLAYTGQKLWSRQGLIKSMAAPSSGCFWWSVVVESRETAPGQLYTCALISCSHWMVMSLLMRKILLWKVVREHGLQSTRGMSKAAF